jgi:hypothetical protein
VAIVSLQTASAPHQTNAADLRRLVERLVGSRPGIFGLGDFLVSALGTPNLSVNVAAGAALVDGSQAADQGLYYVDTAAVANVAVGAGDLTYARKDLVILRVKDSFYSGADNTFTVEVVAGTPAAVPAEPTVPANSFVLALLDVPANATSITGAMITDRRLTTWGLVRATGAPPSIPSAAGRPGSPSNGDEVYQLDDATIYVYSSTSGSWVPRQAAFSWYAYTGAALQASTTNPTLGTGGNAFGRWNREGYTVRGTAYIVFGTGATFGSGTYRLVLPARARSTTGTTAPVHIGRVHLRNATIKAADLISEDSGTSFAVMYDSTGTLLTAANAGLTTTTTISASFSYEHVA